MASGNKVEQKELGKMVGKKVEILTPQRHRHVTTLLDFDDKVLLTGNRSHPLVIERGPGMMIKEAS